MFMNESTYKVLARKYRPDSLASVVGQEELVFALNNSFKNNKVAHGFMLTGIRGVGKTTAARIIAKTINCTQLDVNAEIVNACGECANCLAAASGAHPDIVEMDAASNTSVNDIREVIENSTYTPILGKFKVYIIDEVHMLSTSAFNALLKTLEEPPAHLKFIFATTEIRKVPITVISRCQRYDLKRVDQQKIRQYIEKICNQESINFETQGLDVIANYADGSIRDALSLLDLCAARANYQNLTEKIIFEALGKPDNLFINELFCCLINGDVSQALKLYNQQYSAGIDSVLLVSELLKLTHNLSVDVACKNEIATNFSAQISGKVSVSKLARIWQMLYKGYVDIKAGDVPKLVTEMLLIRICYLADLPTPGELISKYNSSPEGLSLQKDNNQNSNDDIARVLEFFSAEGDMIILQNLRNFANFEQKKEKQITLSYNEKFDEKLIVTIKDKLKKFDANLQIECIKVGANTDHLSIKQKELINLKAHDEMKSLMDSFPEAVISIEK